MFASTHHWSILFVVVRALVYPNVVLKDCKLNQINAVWQVGKYFEILPFKESYKTVWNWLQWARSLLWIEWTYCYDPNELQKWSIQRLHKMWLEQGWWTEHFWEASKSDSRSKSDKSQWDKLRRRSTQEKPEAWSICDRCICGDKSQVKSPSHRRRIGKGELGTSSQLTGRASIHWKENLIRRPNVCLPHY